MNVLLSIRPKYAEAIFSGLKRYEFRRTIFRRKDAERVYVYSNSSVGKIVGSFEIEEILKGTPEEIWTRCHRQHKGIHRGPEEQSPSHRGPLQGGAGLWREAEKIWLGGA